jgi:hypothetical protein
LLDDSLKILEKSRSLPGEDDPMTISLAAAVKSLLSAQSSVSEFVEKGEIIEGF